MIEFFVPGPPKAQGRPRFARIGNGVRAYDPKDSVDYKSWVRVCAQKAGVTPYPVDKPLSLGIKVMILRPKSVSVKKRPFPVAKPDGDNMLKGISDALSIFVRDQQFIEMAVLKQYVTDPKDEGVIVMISDYP